MGVFEQETFDKSRCYQLDKSTYSSVYSLYKVIEFIVRTDINTFNSGK